MRVAISPEAASLVYQEHPDNDIDHVLSEAIRHDLGQLRDGEYAFCSGPGGWSAEKPYGTARFAITYYDRTPLALYVNLMEDIAILFLRHEYALPSEGAFFDQLLPHCSEFHVS